MTTLSDNQQCYAKGSYGSHTTSRYLSLSFWCPSLPSSWTSCLDTVHILFVLFYVGWGIPFLAFAVRGSQAQISVSFVWASARFWRHIGRPRPRMIYPEIPFRSRCIYVEHHNIWAQDVTLNLWYPTWCARYGRYLWNLALLGLFPPVVWSIWYISHHNFRQGSIAP